MLRVHDLSNGKFWVVFWNQAGDLLRGEVSFKDRDSLCSVLQSQFGMSADRAVKETKFLKPNISKLSWSLPGANMTVKHPVVDYMGPLYDIIISLNDEHNWTREQIADWIESFDEVPTFKVE